MFVWRFLHQRREKKSRFEEPTHFLYSRNREFVRGQRAQPVNQAEIMAHLNRMHGAALARSPNGCVSALMVIFVIGFLAMLLTVTLLYLLTALPRIDFNTGFVVAAAMSACLLTSAVIGFLWNYIVFRRRTGRYWRLMREGALIYGEVLKSKRVSWGAGHSGEEMTATELILLAQPLTDAPHTLAYITALNGEGDVPENGARVLVLFVDEKVYAVL